MACMLGFGGVPLTSAPARYYLKSCAVLFLTGILGVTPLVRNAARKISQTTVGAVLEPLVLAALLLVCTAYLVDGSFSPFLYFRF